MGFGANELSRQPELTLTSFKMGIPFMEGVIAGTREQIQKVVIVTENPQLFGLAQSLQTLAKFGQLPEVQAGSARQGSI